MHALCLQMITRNTLVDYLRIWCQKGYPPKTAHCGEVGTFKAWILATGISDTSNLGGGGICNLSNGGRSHTYGLNSCGRVD